MPKFSVDIQHIEEVTYQVEADDEDAACELAMLKYTLGDEANHEEVVGTGAVTNCEEIRT